MEFKKKKHLLLMAIGLMGLGGCQAPHGGHYNNAAYDAPSYDATVYAPQYAAEPAYDASYYHEGAYGDR